MKKLQKKMIAVVFLSVITVFAILAPGYYFTTVFYNTNQADALTRVISYNNGSMPKLDEFNEQEFEEETGYRINLTPEAEYRTRYFVVRVQEDDSKKVETDHISSVTEKEALGLYESVMLKHRKKGNIGSYRYRIVDKDGKIDYVIFLDCTDHIVSQKATLNIAIFLSILFALLVSSIFASLSSRILRPFELNQKAQKQFITDASHELKTPLAIISANAEVLKYKNGDNEWTQNIISQAGHMGKLINQLLILSRMEEYAENDKRELLNYSEIVNASLNKFNEVLLSKNIEVERNISDDVCVNGVRSQIENLCDILIENASKYVTDGGKMAVTLEKSGKKAVFSVFNTSASTEDFDEEKIFDRFFRTDKSRTSSTGGHGIGLSIAKKIVERHRGTIGAKVVGDGVCFTTII